VNQPEILFLDEPTLGLDPASTAEIREMIRKINAENATTMILTTHMMVEADMLCRRIGIIDRGKIVALDTPANLKKIVSGNDTTILEFEIPNLSPTLIAAIGSLKCVGSVVQDDETHVKVHARGDDCFDVLVDGEKVATQTLEASPAELFDFEYKLAEALTHGKQRITVKFQSLPNAGTGNVFDVRIIK